MAASKDASPGTRLDRLIGESRTPGIQYLVVDRERTRFAYAGGWADLPAHRPMHDATTMMAYSMSKTFTAAAVLLLVQAGKLSLDDPLARYDASQPYGPAVTVRELLAHTSGIPNPIPLRWVHPVSAHATFDERAALAAVLRAHPRLASAPGARFAYSNIGYWLLGRVIESASGESFAAFVTRSLLGPLGIAPAELGYAIGSAADHAHGCLERHSLLDFLKGWLIDRELIGPANGRWVEIRDHYLNGPAFGGLVGTASGVAEFLRDQLATRSAVMSEATRELFYSQQRVTGGRAIPMTLGWHLDERAGLACHYKEGGGGGFHCMMRVYRSRGIASVVMTNATSFDVRGLLDRCDLEVAGA